MLENRLEDEVVQQAARRRGEAHKWGINGWPDRMVLLPPKVREGRGRIGFIELKKPGGASEPTALQERNLRVLRGMGFIAAGRRRSRRSRSSSRRWMTRDHCWKEYIDGKVVDFLLDEYGKLRALTMGQSTDAQTHALIVRMGEITFEPPAHDSDLAGWVPPGA